MNTSCAINSKTVINSARPVSRLIGERSSAGGAETILIDTACLRKLAFSIRVDVVSFVTLGADHSILPIGYAVLIPDNTVAVHQDKSVSTLGALGTVVL